MNGGGTIVLRELTPALQANVEAILPAGTRLEAPPADTPLYRADYHPLLAGITNFEFSLVEPEDARVRRDGAGRLAWVPVLPADAGAIPLTTPAAITLMPQGRGRLLIDQLNWEWGLKNDEDNTCRIISNLLNNLGIRMMPNISYNAE